MGSAIDPVRLVAASKSTLQENLCDVTLVPRCWDSKSVKMGFVRREQFKSLAFSSNLPWAFSGVPGIFPGLHE
jgi:hypothetical protein